MIYTHSYWKEFCQNCLEKEIHHSPTKGGDTELDKHYNLYKHTLALYTREFNEEAPLTIWENINTRFTKEHSFFQNL